MRHHLPRRSGESDGAFGSRDPIRGPRQHRTVGSDSIGDVAVKCLKGTVTLSGRVDRKTTHEIALKLAANVPGVLKVRDRLEHEWDDTKLRLPVPAPDRRHWASRP